jgi:hypothetical protein
VAISAPLEVAMAFGTAPESPPGASANARGVLGSPTGHPFFIVHGDYNKAPRWQRMVQAMRSAEHCLSYKDRREVESTPCGSSVPTPRGLLARCGASVEVQHQRWRLDDERGVLPIN